MDHLKHKVLKYPFFMPDNSALWFCLMRSYFVIYNIPLGSQQFHSYLIAVGPVFEILIRDLVTNPPSEEELGDPSRYDKIRNKFMQRLDGHKINLLSLDGPGSVKEPLRSSRFPRFMPNDPVLWFAFMESYFVTYNIRSGLRKYHTFLINVGPQFVLAIKDLVLKPPSEEVLSDSRNYREKKEQLRRRYRGSRSCPVPEEEELEDKTRVGDTWTEDSPFPPFMPDEVELWFGLMNSYFIANDIHCGIQKYHSFLIAVGPEYMDWIHEFMLRPPSEEDLLDDSRCCNKIHLLYRELRKIPRRLREDEKL